MKMVGKHLVALILVLALAISLTTSVFAVGAGTIRIAEEKTKLLSFGDSVAVTWYDAGCEDCGTEEVENYYARKVAAGLEIDEEDCTFVHRFGLRSSDVYIALGGEKDEDDLLYSMEDQPFCQPDATSDLLSANADTYIQAVKEAEVILLEVGTSDVMFFSQTVSGLEDFFGDIGDKSTDEITEFLRYYTQLVNTGYKNFQKNYYAMLQKIAEYKNSSSKVVLVSAFNPVKGMEIGDLSSFGVESDNPFPIGEIDTPVIAMMNEKIKDWADEFGFLYADITAAPLGCNAGHSFGREVPNDITAMMSYPENCLATHPAFPEGYDYIAQQILNAITQEENDDRSFRIGLATGLDSQNISVSAGGTSITKFTYDAATGILTVRDYAKDTALVRVSIKGENSTSVTVYYIKYTDGRGFTVSYLYQTADIANTMSRITATLKRVTARVSTRLKKILTSAGQ